MQVSIERVNNVERRLTIVIPSEKIESTYQQQIQRIAKTANIKGFRPGKAPLSHIEKQFGADARHEALSYVMQNAFQDAIKEQQLNPISTPRIEPKTLMPNQPFEFTVTFEVLPEMGDIQFKIDEVEKLMVDVTDEDVDYVINQLKKQYSQWKLVERAAQANDRVVINYYPIFEEKADESNKVENYPLELGSNTMLPGFEEGLIGAKAGEERTLHLQFPTDYGVADKAGKPVDFVVQVKQVFEAETPAIDETFIKKLGVKSGQEADLKEQVRKSLEMEKDRLIKDKLKDQVFRHLIEQNPFELPKALIAQEAKHVHDEVHPHQGEHHHSEEEMNIFNEIAKKRVALGLLVVEYAKKANIKPDQKRVEDRIQEIASAYENPPEVVKWLSSNERRSNIESQVMEDQVIEKLIEGIPLVEKRMSYAELKGVRS